MIAIGVFILIVLIAAAAFLTTTVAVSNPDIGVQYPYLSNYAVSFPEGEQMAIGNVHIVVLSYENEILADVDGTTRKLTYGSVRELAERKATIKTLGIPVMDTDFKGLLKYKGERDNRAYFDLTIYTSKQVPDMLIKRLLPPAIDARPL
jgi:hypothetical protein